MKILVVVDFPTHPVMAGNRSCVVSYVEMLRAMGHRVEVLLSFSPFDLATCTQPDLKATREWWGDAFHLHEYDALDKLVWRWNNRLSRLLDRGTRLDEQCVPSLRRRVRDLVAQGGFEAVLLNYWHLSGIFASLDGPRKVMFTHDRFAGRKARTGNGWLSTTEAIEGRAMDRADAVLSIQESESVLFRKHTRTPVLTSFTPFPYTDLPLAGTKDILLLAGPNPDNIAGLRWFADAILPLVRSRVPDARLVVGGRIHVAVPELAGRDGVEITGDVDDLQSFYRRGDLCVNPNRTGTGLKIKTFEALSFGRAMVCHPHCLDGIPHPESAPMMSCSSPEDFAEAICGLLVDPVALAKVCAGAGTYLEAMNELVRSRFDEALRGGASGKAAP